MGTNSEQLKPSSPNLSSARSRRLAAAVIVGSVARAVGTIAPLVLVPMLYNYLGQTRFGVWATVLSVTSMIVFADLGLGSGLLTKVSWAHGRDNSELAARYISNAYLGTILISVTLLAVGSIAALSISPSSILGVTDEAAISDSNAITLILIAAFFISIPVLLIGRVQLAIQQGWQGSLWFASGQILSVPVAWVLIRADSPPAIVILGVVAAPIFVACINTLVFFSRSGRRISPRPKLINREDLRALLAVGSVFSVVSIFSNIAINADNIIVASGLGVDEVSVLTIASRLFRSTTILISLIGMPLWGANGEAMARGDVKWISRTTRRAAILLASATALIAFGLVFFRMEVIELWIGGETVETPFYLYLGLATWSVLYSVVTPFFMVQNASEKIRPQLYGWGAYLVASVPLKYLAIVEFGISALPWVGVVLFSITVLPAAFIGYTRVMRKTTALNI